MHNRLTTLHKLVLITFLLCMGGLMASFYYQSQHRSYLITIQALQAKNQQLAKAVQDAAKQMAPMRKPSPSDPKGSGDNLDAQPQTPSDAQTPSPPAETSIEIGEIKIKITEDASWETIAKILTTILGTFLGIRIINTVFRREEDKQADEPQPAVAKPRKPRR